MILETLLSLLSGINKNNTKLTYITVNGQLEGLFIKGN